MLTPIRPDTAPPSSTPASSTDRLVEVPAGATTLTARLVVPDGATSLVVLVQARRFQQQLHDGPLVGALTGDGIATLAVDLLNEHEATDRRNVLDARLHSARLVEVTSWCRHQDVPSHLGYWAAGTGAAGAFLAGAELGPEVEALVACSALPDLFEGHLEDITAPTLLVAGGADRTVLQLNRETAARLTGCEHKLVVVPAATHFFEEAGARALVGRLATDWFRTHMNAGAGATGGSRESSVPTRPH